MHYPHMTRVHPTAMRLAPRMMPQQLVRDSNPRGGGGGRGGGGRGGGGMARGGRGPGRGNWSPSNVHPVGRGGRWRRGGGYWGWGGYPWYGYAGPVCYWSPYPPYKVCTTYPGYGYGYPGYGYGYAPVW